jgi:hypothetical protein
MKGSFGIYVDLREDVCLGVLIILVTSVTGISELTRGTDRSLTPTARVGFLSISSRRQNLVLGCR